MSCFWIKFFPLSLLKAIRDDVDELGIQTLWDSQLQITAVRQSNKQGHAFGVHK